MDAVPARGSRRGQPSRTRNWPIPLHPLTRFAKTHESITSHRSLNTSGSPATSLLGFRYDRYQHWSSHVTLRRDSLLWLSSQYCSWPSGLKGSQYSDCLGRDCPTVFSTGSNNTWPANKQIYRLIYVKHFNEKVAADGSFDSLNYIETRQWYKIYCTYNTSYLSLTVIFYNLIEMRIF